MTSNKFSLYSSAFENGKAIPSKYAHKGITGGQNVSVSLHWENPPSETKSFALSCVDLHPIANKWVHWLVIDIPAEYREIPEGASRTGSMPKKSKELMNSFGEVGYGGPEPPKGSGLHRYEFTLYSLSIDTLGLVANASLSVFQKAAGKKMLGLAKIVGVFGQ